MGRLQGSARLVKTVARRQNPESGYAGSAQINLVFDPANFALKQWTVNDAQGFQTVVTLFNIDLTAKPDESLFKIDEQRMIGQKR